HVRAVREPLAPAALLAMAADRGADLDRDRSRLRCHPAPALLGGLGDGVHELVPDQSLRAIRVEPGPRARERPRAAAAPAQDAGLLPLRAAPALPWLHARLLGGSGDDGRTPALRRGPHGVRPGGNLFRGARSGRPIRRALSALSRAGGNAAAEAEPGVAR